MDFSHPFALLDGSASSQDESAPRNGSTDRSTSSESVYETASEFGTNTEIPIRSADGDDAQQVQGVIAMESSGTAAGPSGSADQASVRTCSPSTILVHLVTPPLIYTN